IVGSRRTPSFFNAPTKATASLAHAVCPDKSRATGSWGAGLGRFFGMQAASAGIAQADAAMTAAVKMQRAAWWLVMLIAPVALMRHRSIERPLSAVVAL